MSVIYGTTPLKSNGLYGKRFTGYYNDDLSFYSTATIEDDIITTSLDSFTGGGGDYFSWMWLGYFYVPVTGEYTFYTNSDDSSLLWIGDSALLSPPSIDDVVVDNRGPHASIEESGTIMLDAGTYVPIRITWGELTGGEILTVSFSGPGIEKTSNGLGYFFGGKYLWNVLGER